MADNDAVFKFGADTSEVEKSIDGLSGQISSFGKTAGLAIGGLFAASKMVDFFRDSMDAAIESEKAVKSFNFTLKAAGVYSEEASKGFQEYASQLQQVTGIQDEAILAGASTLIEIGELSGKELNRTVVASLDLAARRGWDVATAFDVMARAAQGNVGPFSKMGVEFRNGSTDAERFAQVLDFIESKMGGAAQENLKGYAGAVLQLKNTWGDLQEQFGAFVIENPGMIQSLNLLNEFLKSSAVAASWVVVKFQNMILYFTGFAAMISSALSAAFNKDVSAAFMEEQKQIAENINALTAANNASILSFDSLSSTINSSTIPDFDRAKAAAKSFADELKDLAWKEEEVNEQLRQMHEAFLDSHPTFQSFKKGFLQGMKDMGASTLQLGKQVASTFASGMTNAFASVGKALVEGNNAFGAFGKAILQMLGNVAIQMGQFYIAAGIAALFLNPAQGAGMIAGGAALGVLGGVLQALGGGGSSAAGSTTSSGVSAASASFVSGSNEDLFAQTTEQEREKAKTGVTINVQGNILDRRETGLELAEILNSAFDTNGTLVRANA